MASYMSPVPVSQYEYEYELSKSNNPNSNTPIERLHSTLSEMVKIQKSSIKEYITSFTRITTNKVHLGNIHIRIRRSQKSFWEDF